MEKFEVEVVLKASDGTEYTVSDGAVIGRVEAADIVIADPKVSRQHAKFKLDGGALVIEDLGPQMGLLGEWSEDSSRDTFSPW